MFAQMRGRRNSPSKPCPCHGACLCHKPTKDSFFPMLFPILIPGIFILIVGLAPAPEKHIQVDGKNCIVKHVTDSCNSTGACSGHDITICKE